MFSNAQHGGAQESSDLFLREMARIAALQARQPSPEPEPILETADSGFTPDYKRSPSPEPSPEPQPEPASYGRTDDLFAREISRIRADEIARRSTMTITVGDGKNGTALTIEQKTKRADDEDEEVDDEESEEVEERSLDGDAPDLLSAELDRLSTIAKAKRSQEKEELLRREIERIREVTNRNEPKVEFRRTEEGEALLRREVERIAGLQRRDD